MMTRILSPLADRLQTARQVIYLRNCRAKDVIMSGQNAPTMKQFTGLAAPTAMATRPPMRELASEMRR